MITITVKHLNRNKSRDFHGVRYESAARAEFIRDNINSYDAVAELKYNYMTKDKAMNLAYTDTNSVETAWVDDLNTREYADVYVDICRSTSVGDVFTVQVGDMKPYDYFVDSYGFSPVSESSYEDA